MAAACELLVELGVTPHVSAASLEVFASFTPTRAEASGPRGRASTPGRRHLLVVALAVVQG